jgi:predicted amidohydrolase YtcJ
VIDRNPFKVPVTTIHDTKVEQVYVNGERVSTGK